MASVQLNAPAMEHSLAFLYLCYRDSSVTCRPWHRREGDCSLPRTSEPKLETRGVLILIAGGWVRLREYLQELRDCLSVAEKFKLFLHCPN